MLRFAFASSSCLAAYSNSFGQIQRPSDAGSSSFDRTLYVSEYHHSLEQEEKESLEADEASASSCLEGSEESWLDLNEAELLLHIKQSLQAHEESSSTPNPWLLAF